MRLIHQEIKEKFTPQPWSITETDWESVPKKDSETIFSLANGYLGVRGGFEEEFEPEATGTDFDAMINGVYTFFDYHHVWARPGFPKRWHTITTQMNPFNITVYCNNEKICLQKGKVKDYVRRLDLYHAFTERSFVFVTNDNTEVTIKFQRFISLSVKQLSCSKIQISTNQPADIKIESKLSKRCAPDERKDDIRSNEKWFCEWQEIEDVNGTIVGSQKMNVSGFKIACAFNDDFAFDSVTVEEKDLIKKVYSFCSEPNKEYVYYRFNAHTTDIDFSENYKEFAEKIVLDEKGRGYEKCFSDHKKQWEKFWDNSNIEIDGDDSIQQGIRYCLFSINASVGRDGKTNISANGLMGIWYAGHTFWDTEIFMLPMFLYSDPKVAKNLLMFRYNKLDKARERAKQMDHVGALFPWNTTDGEESGHVFEIATAQYHINNDIFYSIYRYYETTGDHQFMADYGAEILFEISRCMAHRGAFIPLRNNKFCINVVCGPDEYSPVVDNNMYTNYLTRKQLYFALEICELLKERYPEKYKVLYEKCSLSPEELDLWKRAADNMYIGYNKELDIYTQDDQFLYRDPVDIEWLAKNKYPLLHNFHPLNLWRMQVCKQADIVLLMFLYGYEFDKPMIKRIFDYYEPRTIHDSSLSASIHSIVAMDIGYVNESYNYLKQSCRMDLDNYNRNVEHGIHAACCGAAFMMIVNGYGGMRVYDNMLHFTPRIDRRWNYCKFKILFAGSRIEVKINKKTTVYTLLEGEGFKFKHNSSLYKIDKDNKVLELNNEIMEKF